MSLTRWLMMMEGRERGRVAGHERWTTSATLEPKTVTIPVHAKPFSKDRERERAEPGLAPTGRACDGETGTRDKLEQTSLTRTSGGEVGSGENLQAVGSSPSKLDRHLGGTTSVRMGRRILGRGWSSQATNLATAAGKVKSGG